MALEEKSVVDKVEVLLNGCIQVRRRDQILKDGVEVAATYHRHVVNPGDDTANEDPRVAAIATAINSMDGVVNGDNAAFAINRNYNAQLTYFV